MLIEIPIVVNGPWFEFSIDIDETTYVFEFQYNDRINRWFLTIKDVNNTVLYAGIKLLIDTPLIQNVVVDGLFPYWLFMMNDSKSSTEPNFESLGVDSKLYYDNGVIIP